MGADSAVRACGRRFRATAFERQITAEVLNWAFGSRTATWGVDEPAAAAREELRKLFDTATPHAKKRPLGVVLEKIIVNGTRGLRFESTLHCSTFRGASSSPS